MSVASTKVGWRIMQLNDWWLDGISLQCFADFSNVVNLSIALLWRGNPVQARNYIFEIARAFRSARH